MSQTDAPRTEARRNPECGLRTIPGLSSQVSFPQVISLLQHSLDGREGAKETGDHPMPRGFAPLETQPLRFSPGRGHQALPNAESAAAGGPRKPIPCSNQPGSHPQRCGTSATGPPGGGRLRPSREPQGPAALPNPGKATEDRSLRRTSGPPLFTGRSCSLSKSCGDVSYRQTATSGLFTRLKSLPCSEGYFI